MQTVDRLLTYFTPKHYQLSLQLERRPRTFSGIVTIQGSSNPGAQKILLHAKNLTIDSVTLDGKTADFARKDSDEFTITHPDLKEGKHIIVVAFKGIITDAMHGLYPCYYQHKGEKKELIATQFESHHAREVFPCIDEPEAKATFDVTLTTEDNVTVLGNMPIKQQVQADEKLVTTFMTTPRMSTYLLAWVVGELHRKTAVTKGGVKVNVWATPAQKPESLDFALDVATKTIDFFDDYFGTPYPLPKSDHVALPDFSAGAMENWGLITYREVALLADPQASGISSKQYIALVVAHELSHQWFGNLVTMKWWNNLWLNESFATLMEYIAVDALYPEWNMWLEFSCSENILALRRDSLDGVQPVQTEVHHPDEINTLFDSAIVYAKGARLLRMLQHYIGHEAFQAGLKAYFQAFAYQNTEGNDLWKALSEASGKDIAAFMNTWISQPGYPVVSVQENAMQVQLAQKQFFIGQHTASQRLWPIPLNAAPGTLPQLLGSAETTVAYNSSLPVRLNIGDSAHFITQYDPALLEKLVKAIDQFTPLDRLQLLHEQLLLARSGAVPTASLVPLLLAYQNETHEAVWNIISLTIGELRKFIEGESASERLLRALYVRLATPQYQRLGWHKQENESEADTKLRATIIGMMLYGEDAATIARALELHKAKDLKALDPELRGLIIGAAVRHGHANILPQLIRAYKESPLADIKQDIASGITSTRDPQDIEKIITLLKDTSVIRTQDVRQWFVWTIYNRYGREAAWQWLQNNWPWIKETFGSGMSYDDFPRYSANALITRRQLEEYRAFFAPLQNEPALTRVIAIGLNEIEARVERIEQDAQAVKAALAQL